jgi:hypothetical protein
MRDAGSIVPYRVTDECSLEPVPAIRRPGFLRRLRWSIMRMRDSASVSSLIEPRMVLFTVVWFLGSREMPNTGIARSHAELPKFAEWVARFPHGEPMGVRTHTGMGIKIIVLPPHVAWIFALEVARVARIVALAEPEE